MASFRRFWNLRETFAYLIYDKLHVEFLVKRLYCAVCGSEKKQ